MMYTNHLIFSLSFCIFILKLFNIKYIYITNILISCLLGSIIPDIDHTNSFIGNRIKYISLIIKNKFGHRQITHSFLFLVLLYILIFYLNFFNILNLNLDFKYGLFIGCVSHIVADMLTYRGVKFFWPFYYNVKFYLKFLNFNKNKKIEYYFCLFLLFLACFYEKIFCMLNVLIKFLYKIYYYVHIISD